jgi:dihydroceramidase
MSYILPAADVVTNEGYWEPHTSSVDFCEPNYLHSTYIAEFHNVWSSVFISVLALLGMYYSNPMQDLRTIAMFTTLFSVGVGSVALHSTLRDFGQAADEVPMLWVNISLIFCLSTMHSRKSVVLSAILWFCIGILQTIGYFTMRHVYDFFLFSFMSTSVVVFGWTAAIVLSDRTGPEWELRWFLYRSCVISFVCIGFALWVYEMNHCATLLPLYVQAGGATFHILWHLGSGFGAYLQILLMVAVRLQTLGNVAELKWMGGILPVIANGGPVPVKVLGA